MLHIGSAIYIYIYIYIYIALPICSMRLLATPRLGNCDYCHYKQSNIYLNNNRDELNSPQAIVLQLMLRRRNAPKLTLTFCKQEKLVMSVQVERCLRTDVNVLRAKASMRRIIDEIGRRSNNVKACGRRATTCVQCTLCACVRACVRAYS